MKIYTQSKSWLAKFTLDISRGIIAAIAATVLLTGVLVTGLVLSGGGPVGSGDGPQAPGSGDGTSQVMQQAPPTLSSIQQINQGDWTIYRNTWSDGSTTTCTAYVFADGTQSANGDCAPDGVANGMTSP